MKTYGGDEEIGAARLGKFFLKVGFDLLKIVACVALAIVVLWIFVPDPWWRYLSFAPQMCGVLYPLLRRGSGVEHGEAKTYGCSRSTH